MGNWATAMAERAVLIVLAVLLLSFIHSALSTKQSYVVYLGGQHDGNLGHQLVADSHHELLGSVLGSKEVAKDAIFYSYTRCINGFAATLDDDQALALSQLPQVLSVFVNRARSPQTTRSWGFLGLESEDEEVPPQSLWTKANFGKDVIIANLDTGIWPEAASFSDTDMDPVPFRWKGLCQNGTEFGAAQCNRKLIGARYFVKGYEAEQGPLIPSTTGENLSPRDMDGHGTHTLSIAAGNFVKNASMYGYAEGIAKGGAPQARVASYKVCWSIIKGGTQCYDADIIAAFDQGIQDGVDVFSVSLGDAPSPSDYFQSGISIGSFHAVQRGKVVVCAAGNEGPTPGTVENVGPWIITVGASSIDRQFPSAVTLGNNKSYIGQSLLQFQLPEKKMYPLVASEDASFEPLQGQFCLPKSLDPSKVKGKIVACSSGDISGVEQSETVRMAGGLGMILFTGFPNTGDIIADAYVLPATNLKAVDKALIFDYIKSTVSPVAYISPTRTELNTKPAPVMTSFSAQGPNRVTPDILKPDITAPGLNILAAYSLARTATDSPSDDKHVPFNILSGTSMSTPHIAGVAALLKGAHPDWSPAAIKSAIMTTAIRVDNAKEPIKDAQLQRAGPFSYGAGHVNPNVAGNPGLVYDLSVNDYYLFFCSLNFNSIQIKAITGQAFHCPVPQPKTHNLNYPSIAISELKGSVIVQRTVTNMAEGSATYKAKVESPDGVSVTVEPKELQFYKKGEKKAFSVTLTALKSSGGEYVFGFLAWENAQYVAASSIVVNSVAIQHEVLQ